MTMSNTDTDADTPGHTARLYCEGCRSVTLCEGDFADGDPLWYCHHCGSVALCDVCGEEWTNAHEQECGTR